MKTLIIGANALLLCASNPGKGAVLDEGHVPGDREVTSCGRFRV